MVDIKDKTKCCGCWACYDICPKQCISMDEDYEGFRYPVVDLDVCIRCGLCEKACPELHPTPDEPFEQKAFLLQHNDPQILAESTSGGAFTAIASWVLERGGVVFGAGYDENFVVKHQYVEDVASLSKFRNSKYVQSEIGESFKQALRFLKEDRWVCFSGTPCHIEGLLLFLRKDYPKLLTVDIMCHSVTSPKVFRRYVEEQSDKLGSPDKILFRDKRPYGYEYSQMSIYKGGKQVYHEGVETDPYLRSFFSDMNVRPSCYHCLFKKQHHRSDFTIWDCFDADKFNTGIDIKKGVTRILANTQLARDILAEISDQVIIAEIPVEKAVQGVVEMFHSVRMNPDRETLFRDINEDKPLSAVYPVRARNVIEKIIRRSLISTGVYSGVKRMAKTVIKDLKRK